jgi:hypothetical protein
MVSEHMLERVREIYNEYLSICTEKPQNIFIDEYIDGEGQRQYECVNFFSPNFHFAAESFLGKNVKYQVSPLNKNIISWKIEKTDYNLIKASANSRINIIFYFSDTTGASLKASGENCEVALSILKTYVMPNLA